MYNALSNLKWSPGGPLKHVIETIENGSMVIPAKIVRLTKDSAGALALLLSFPWTMPQQLEKYFKHSFQKTVTNQVMQVHNCPSIYLHP